MTRPDPRRTDPRQAQQQARMTAAMSGAVDLSAVKARAEAAQKQPAGGQNAAGQPAASGQFIVDLDEAGFQDVIERSLQVPVIIDLWAQWCEPCKQLSPVLERLAQEGNGSWILAKVDVDANPRIAQLFGAQSIPTVVAVAAGQPVDAFSGALPEPEVRQWITGLLDALRDRLPGIAAAEAGATGDDEPEPEADDERFTDAENKLADGDYDGAAAAYEAILDAEPGNEEAKLALAQVRFTQRAENTEADSVAKSDAAPDDANLQLAAADHLVGTGAAEAAFDRLIAAIARSAGEERNRLREHLVSLFELFPADDERVGAARRKLASALF